MRHFLIVLTVSLGFLILSPDTAHAQSGSDPQTYDSQIVGPSGETGSRFIPCSGTNCSACHFAALGNAVVGFLISMVAIIFAVLMVVSGFRLVISGGSPDKRSAAKDSLTNAIIGLLIILAAWLLVDTLMRVLVGNGGEVEGYGPWTTIQCWEQRRSTEVAYKPDVLDVESISGTDAAFSGGPGVTPSGNLVTYEGRKFDEAVLDKARYLNDNFDLRISGGHRTPERNRAVGGSETSYHLSGRAIDLVGSEEAMQAGARWARQNGAREVIIHDAGSGRHLHVAW